MTESQIDMSADTEDPTDSPNPKGLSEEMIRTVEALLFAAEDPLPPSTLAPALNGNARSTLDTIVAEINFRLGEGNHPMRVRKVGGGYQMHVLPEFAPAIEAALVKTKIQRLSRAGLETLAIIAYKQPCSTPDIELIRGVSSGGVLNTLLERNLISITGRSDGPGRPLLYGTTREFLTYFGLNSLDDLPRIEELEQILAEREPANLLPLQTGDTGMPEAELPGPLTLRRGPEGQSDGQQFVIEDVSCATNNRLKDFWGADNGHTEEDQPSVVLDMEEESSDVTEVAETAADAPVKTPDEG